MKLKTYNKTNVIIGTKQLEPVIRVSVKGTRFILSPGFLIRLKEPFKVGDKVALIQDEDRPQDWYLTKDPDYGFKLSPLKKEGVKNQALYFCNKDLCKRILEGTSCKGYTGVVQMYVNPDPKEYEGLLLYEIATRTATKKSKTESSHLNLQNYDTKTT